MEGLIKLYTSQYGNPPERIEEIPLAVSTRRYFRLHGHDTTIVGTYSPDIRETIAFTSFATHFRTKGIQVPEIICVSDDHECYLQSDLGDQRMHELVVSRPSKELRDSDLANYKLAIDQLVKLQIEGYEGLDFSISVPRPAFDHQSVMWDLNHFKYYFLKPLGIAFDENELEEAFKDYANYLSQLPNDGFMFRDFQTRNIMMLEGRTWFIDFQGGRKGPLQYDLASLVFEAKAGLSYIDRDKLINYYISVLAKYRTIDQLQFKREFYIVALIRILQVLGTYGLRGVVEKKAVFLQSTPNGLKNLDFLLKNLEDSPIRKDFRSVLKQVVGCIGAFQSLPDKFEGLTVRVTSFSYRKPLPDDISGNGGGFVYDCRFLHNPGLYEDLKHMTGLDTEIQDFLQNKSEAPAYIESIKGQLNSVIAEYKSRNYDNLMVSFGCTGGRHRSVYSARMITDWLRKQEGIRVLEVHREIGKEF
jgi:aminoglycoside/choline kinase family phosphotransferase